MRYKYGDNVKLFGFSGQICRITKYPGQIRVYYINGLLREYIRQNENILKIVKNHSLTGIGRFPEIPSMREMNSLLAELHSLEKELECYSDSRDYFDRKELKCTTC